MPESPESPESPGSREGRRFDPWSLAAGLFFLGVAGIYLASGFSGDDILPLDVLVPVLLIGLGVVGLIGVITRSRRH